MFLGACRSKLDVHLVQTLLRRQSGWRQMWCGMQIHSHPAPVDRYLCEKCLALLVRYPKVCVVQNVEEFAAKLQSHAFSDRNVFVDREIPLL